MSIHGQSPSSIMLLEIKLIVPLFSHHIFTSNWIIHAVYTTFIWPLYFYEYTWLKVWVNDLFCMKECLLWNIQMKLILLIAQFSMFAYTLILICIKFIVFFIWIFSEKNNWKFLFGYLECALHFIDNSFDFLSARMNLKKEAISKSNQTSYQRRKKMKRQVSSQVWWIVTVCLIYFWKYH